MPPAKRALMQAQQAQLPPLTIPGSQAAAASLPSPAFQTPSPGALTKLTVASTVCDISAVCISHGVAGGDGCEAAATQQQAVNHIACSANFC